MNEKMSRPPPYQHREEFERYIELARQDAEHGRSTAEQQTKLNELERLMLKATFVLHDAVKAGFQDTPTGACVRVLFAKMSNEVFSFIACARACSLYGAWHHARALIEVRAALRHLFDDSNATPRRLEQFNEYPRLLTWQWRKKMDAQVAACVITEAVMKRRVPDERMAELAQHEARWLGLFEAKSEAKLIKRRHWHTEPLQDLVDALGYFGQESYEMFCHATHVSPVGHRLASVGEPQALGFDLDNLNRGIAYVAQNVIETLRVIDNTDAIVFLDDSVPKELFQHAAEEIAAMMPADAFEPEGA